MRRHGSLALAFVLLAGCSSPARLPEPVLRAAGEASADGGTSLEVDAEGELEQISADIPLSRLPQLVKDVVEREMPGGRIVRCERQWRGESAAYAITKVILALRRVAVVDDAGRLLRTENEIPVARAPQIILDSANQAVAGGSIQSVIELREGDRLQYRIRKRVGEQLLVIEIGSGGDVRHTLREVPTELYLPASR